MERAKRVFLKRYNKDINNVDPNALESEAIREGRRFLPTFFKKVERKA